MPQGVRGGGQEVKEAIRARCPLCGGEIIVSEYYQTSRDYKVLMNGKLSKRYIVTDAGPINSMTASCGSFCGAYWEHEEFDISEDGMHRCEDDRTEQLLYLRRQHQLAIRG